MPLLRAPVRQCAPFAQTGLSEEHLKEWFILDSPEAAGFFRIEAENQGSWVARGILCAG